MPAPTQDPYHDDTELRVGLGFPLPDRLAPNRPTAIFCFGACFHRERRIESIELVAGGERHRVTAAGMPRPDVFAHMHPKLDPASVTFGDRDPSSADPALRSFRSGFWATVTVTAPAAAKKLELEIEARLADGEIARAALGAIEVRAEERPPLPKPCAGELVAICMATFEPDLELFARQIESLRAQTHSNWICLVSDDCSEPGSLTGIRKLIGDDERFVISPATERLGFYRNFERALRMVPREADLVALCDQDDAWYPEKLETLIGELGDAELVYSDQRLVDASGQVLAETLWDGRRNNFTDLASLLVANTVTGAAALFRRAVAEDALPFPQMPGWQFHDHWIALVALSRGRLAYVDRPLYDYVQHPGAILGQVAAGGEATPTRSRRAVAGRTKDAVRAFMRGWRPIYFCGYLRLEVQARTLLARCDEPLEPVKRRMLERFVEADRAVLDLGWLGARAVRGIVRRNETLGAESQLLRGLLWRRITKARTRRRRAVFARDLDASFPVCDPDSFGQRGLRRWRSRRL